MPPSGGTAAAVVARWWQQGVGDHRMHRTWMRYRVPLVPDFSLTFPSYFSAFAQSRVACGAGFPKHDNSTQFNVYWSCMSLRTVYDDEVAGLRRDLNSLAAGVRAHETSDGRRRVTPGQSGGGVRSGAGRRIARFKNFIRISCADRNKSCR